MAALLPLVGDLIAGRGLEREPDDASIEQAITFGLGVLLDFEASASGFVLPVDARRIVAAESMRRSSRASHAAAALAALATVFGEHDVPLRTFKGLANALVLYPPAIHRPFSDVDVFVGACPPPAPLLRQLRVAESTVSALGELEDLGRQVYATGGSWAGLGLDLQWNLFGFTTQLVDAAAIARQFEPLAAIPGVSVPSRELALLIALMNLVRDGGGAVWAAADAARVLSDRTRPVDWELCEHLARAEGLTRPFHKGLAVLVEDLALDIGRNVPGRRPHRRSTGALELGAVRPIRSRDRLTFGETSPTRWPEAARVLLRRVAVPRQLLAISHGLDQRPLVTQWTNFQRRRLGRIMTKLKRRR